MTTLDSVPITACHECIATLTLPLALFLLLAETTVGGVVTVAFLRLTGGLTHGFLKFISVTYAILAALAFLVVVAAPPGSYHRLLAVNQFAAAPLPYLQGLLVITIVIKVVMTWRREDGALRGGPAARRRRPCPPNLPDALVHVDHRPALSGDDRDPAGPAARAAAALRRRLCVINRTAT